MKSPSVSDRVVKVRAYLTDEVFGYEHWRAAQCSAPNVPSARYAVLILCDTESDRDDQIAQLAVSGRSQETTACGSFARSSDTDPFGTTTGLDTASDAVNQAAVQRVETTTDSEVGRSQETAEPHQWFCPHCRQTGINVAGIQHLEGCRESPRRPVPTRRGPCPLALDHQHRFTIAGKYHGDEQCEWCMSTRAESEHLESGGPVQAPPEQEAQ